MLITDTHWNDLLVEYIKFFHVYVNVVFMREVWCHGVITVSCANGGGAGG